MVGLICSDHIYKQKYLLGLILRYITFMFIKINIIRFTGKNFSTWEFQFKIFLKGKELSNHIDSFVRVPTNEIEFTQWEVNDAKVISLLLGTIKLHRITNLWC